MIKTLMTTMFLAIGISTTAVNGQAPAIPPAAEQIAATVLAAPDELRADATVLGYDAAGKLTTLRKGSNILVCLADNPTDNKFNAACYHRDLEPYMARGRELVAQGVTGGARNDEYRWKEIREGKLSFPKEPRLLYVMSGKSYDPASGKVVDGVVRWVIYVPNATAESTGLSTAPKRGEPWLMDAGTLGAHIMITPK
ncbi:MAG: hypothetical protein ACK5RR_15525 [Acidobacteriota bacterium]|jgi:hypothetical protein